MNIKNDLKETGSALWNWFLLLVIIGFVCTLVALYEFGAFAFFAPRYEEIRRQTFEQSRAFQEGTVRNLDKLCLEYATSEGSARIAIQSAIRHQVSDIPANLLPPCARDIKGY